MAFAFTPENEKQVDWLLSRYPTSQAALLPVLRLVEEQEQEITEEAMRVVAERLQLPPSLVLGVFTFYTHYRRPATGTNLVQICSTLPCALRGSAVIEDIIAEELGIRTGQTTDDGKFTFMKVECLGSCGTAPVVQINDVYYERLTEESIREILRNIKQQDAPPSAAVRSRHSDGNGTVRKAADESKAKQQKKGGAAPKETLMTTAEPDAESAAEPTAKSDAEPKATKDDKAAEKSEDGKKPEKKKKKRKKGKKKKGK
jgi:NADH-quinone oxidoreductase subunit E